MQCLAQSEYSKNFWWMHEQKVGLPLWCAGECWTASSLEKKYPNLWHLIKFVMFILPAWPISSYKCEVTRLGVGKRWAQLSLKQEEWLWPVTGHLVIGLLVLVGLCWPTLPPVAWTAVLHPESCGHFSASLWPVDTWQWMLWSLNRVQEKSRDWFEVTGTTGNIALD